MHSNVQFRRNAVRSVARWLNIVPMGTSPTIFRKWSWHRIPTGSGSHAVKCCFELAPRLSSVNLHVQQRGFASGKPEGTLPPSKASTDAHSRPDLHSDEIDAQPSGDKLPEESAPRSVASSPSIPSVSSHTSKVTCKRNMGVLHSIR